MRKKILVIEDDPVATRLVEYILKNHGYQVLTTPNGLEGLQIARKESPDLIILNVMLPGIDGLEVCRRLRAEEQAAQPLILMLSGKAQPADVNNGLDMGADDYLTKPAAPSEILSRVEGLLAKKAGANSKTVVFIGSREKVGTTTTAVNIAIALTQMGKQVIAVDLYPHDGSIAGYLGIKLRGGMRNFLKPGSPDRSTLEPSLAAHESGLGVLSIRQPPADSDINDNIDLPLDRFREVTDYFVVDLPFEPTVISRTLLLKCDLAIIVSDYTTEALAGVKSTITILRFLGIPLKKIGAVITDPVGTFSREELPNIRSYIEPSIAVSIWGTIPYDAAIKTASGDRSAMLSVPDSPALSAVKELARRITEAEITGNDTSPGMVKKA